MEPVSGDEPDAVMLAAFNCETAVGVNVVEAVPDDPVRILIGKTEPPLAVQSTVRFWTG